jgi:hypothetical protein
LGNQELREQIPAAGTGEGDIRFRGQVTSAESSQVSRSRSATPLHGFPGFWMPGKPPLIQLAGSRIEFSDILGEERPQEKKR